MSEPIKILIADDHPIFRRGLRMVIESDFVLKVVAEVDNGADAIKRIEELEPDVAVLDVNMPQADGLTVAKTIQEKHLPTVPVFLTMNAVVVLTDANGNTRSARTTTFGYYRFTDVEAGQTYIFSVRSKRFQFAPQVISVTENLNELNFTGQ